MSRPTLAEALASDFKGQEMRSRTLSLSVDGEDLEYEVFWRPINLSERARIAKLDGNDDQVIGILVMKALDENGDPLFTVKDKPVLKQFARPDLLSELAAEMLLSQSLEDAAKN